MLLQCHKHVKNLHGHNVGTDLWNCLPDYKICISARRFIQHNELTGKNKNKTIHNIKGSEKKRVPLVLDLGTR